MTVAQLLAGALGTYFGTGDGPESGPFVARIEVGGLPNGGVQLAYEATSREQGVQHREVTMLVAGPDGRDRLYAAHEESPFVTVMVEDEAGSGRFVQPEPFGPYVLAIVIEVPDPRRLTYAWHWAHDGESPVEQSRADVRLLAPDATA